MQGMCARKNRETTRNTSLIKKNIDIISDWIESPKVLEIKYKDESKKIIETIINDYESK